MLCTRTTNGHSLISPSGATRWASCAGSVRLTMNEENKTNAMAQRGTDIHQLGEMMLKGETFEVGVSVPRELHGDDKPSMFWANADMVEEATNYCNYVHDLATDPSAEILAEAKVVIIPEYDVNGHIDATVINNKTLHIVDLKTGRGEVSAEENMQLQLYALGTLDEHDMFYDFDTVVLHIVQDNAMISNTHSWETTPEDLEDFREWITERARLALQEDSICTPSEKACQWCSHASKCEGLMEEVTGAFEMVEDDVKSDTNLSIDVISFIMSKRKMFDTAMKAYEGRIEDEIRQGNDVEGFKLVKGRKNKRWVNENEAYDKLKTWLPLDDIAPRKLLSPTQATKLLKGGDISARKSNIFDTLFEVPEGDIKLVASSAKGEPVVFGEDFEDL